MHPLALTASEAAAWAGLITAAGGVIVSIIAALKGSSANAKADVLNNRADALASHAQSLDRQITAVAQGQPVPTATPAAPESIDLQAENTQSLASRPIVSPFALPPNPPTWTETCTSSPAPPPKQP